MWHHLSMAFGDVLTVATLALMALGTAAGLIAGAIPGFTITMAIVLTLPFTFGMTPIHGLATMLGGRLSQRLQGTMIWMVRLIG